MKNIFFVIKLNNFIGADWLQGPHVYALYESYGLRTRDISSLFVAGFGSSLALGTIVASYGDKMWATNPTFVVSDLPS